MSDFIAGLLAGNKEDWFLLIVIPVAIYGLLFGKRGGGDGGDSGSFGSDGGGD